MLIATDKAPIINALRLDAFIDDRPENCVDVVAHTSARVMMPDRPWNQGEFEGVERTHNLIEALEILGFGRASR